MLILNFHGLGPPPQGLDPEELECWLESDVFESVLDLVTSRKGVELTFDDGNSTDFDIALPHLVQRGLRATFFVSTSRIGSPRYLGSTQIRQLSDSGMRIGSHGKSHVSWRSLDTPRLQRELSDSRCELEQITGRPVTEAAVPFGAYDRRVLGALRAARFATVYTSDGGRAISGHWLQPRNTIIRAMPLDRVRWLVDCGPGPLARLAKHLAILRKQLRTSNPPEPREFPEAVTT